MKINCLLIFSTLFFLISCGNKEADKQKSIEMVTIRTLGLAYLEENKLNEAEIEFLKLIEIAPDEALGHANLALVYLRKGEYDKAEVQIKNALKLTPEDPDINLNLAEIYELTSRESEAVILLENSLQTSPAHNRTLYRLANLYIGSGDPEARKRAQECLAKVVESLPANLPARLQFVELTLRNGEPDRALMHLEEIRKLLPELSPEPLQYFQKGIELLQASQSQEAITAILIFRNFMRVTPFYQAGVHELKGRAGPLTGTPLLTFSQDVSVEMQQQEAILDAMRFTDATAGAGLNVVNDALEIFESSELGALAVADFDRDGDQDLYVSVWLAKEKRTISFLLRNEFGRFEDVSAASGVAHAGRDLSAIFADYDNDGFLDLFLTNSRENRLYANIADGKFENVVKKAGLANPAGGASATFADFDHDSDLDIYVTNSGKNQLFRNNGNKTFTELSEKMGIAGNVTESRQIAFGDFDEDGDLDFFVANPIGHNTLYTNLRQGQFEDVTDYAGLANSGGSRAVIAGDYDNDGFLDIFVTGPESGENHLYRNIGSGIFDEDTRSTEMLAALHNVRSHDTHFLDFDNDGLLDILVVGESLTKAGRGILLFHNVGKGKFEEETSLLPADLLAGRKVVIADYNEDGDLDLFITGVDGSIRLLRNDGANANKYLKVQLVGIRKGSGKNNHFGIGSKLQVRAGDSYQVRTVTEPVTHFGLGQRRNIDVVRIVWPNGVPQNLFSPGSDQDLVEEQILKGSCAFVYAWDGDKYQFVTDIIWRSALGMPLGIMAGETAYAFPNSSQDYFRIPGSMLREKDGVYSIQVTEELWETAFIDQIHLLAVDHPDSADVFIDERFVPPPVPPLELFTVTQKHTPKSAADGNGNDLLSKIQFQDDVYISNLTPAKYQGTTEFHELILDLGDLSDHTKIILYLSGWLFPADASINVALAQSDELKIIFPYLQVMDQDGVWQTVLNDLSFPMGKNKMVIVDLTGKFLTSDYRVRIGTNMEIYWDHIFFTTDGPDIPFRMTKLKPVSGNIHYRGFSRLYRKGGRYGPHWFDYRDVSVEQKWRDLTGNYTRYGDVLPLLLESDDKFAIVNAGDEITIEFDARQAPKLKPDWTRDFIIFGDGWIKDGDLNTAHGQTVGPLPYHGMSSYPYGPDDGYPNDDKHQQFIKEYNTREVMPNQLRPASGL